LYSISPAIEEGGRYNSAIHKMRKRSVVYVIFSALFSGVNGFLLSSSSKKHTDLRRTCSSDKVLNHGPSRRLSELFNAENDSLSDETEEEEFDFEAAFQKRVDKEGGVTGIKVKSTTRSVTNAANSVAEDVSKASDSVKQTFFQTPGDPDTENFTLKSIFLVFVMLVAGGVLFNFAMSAPFSDDPFETTIEGKSLMFGN